MVAPYSLNLCILREQLLLPEAEILNKMYRRSIGRLNICVNAFNPVLRQHNIKSLFCCFKGKTLMMIGRVEFVTDFAASCGKTFEITKGNRADYFAGVGVQKYKKAEVLPFLYKTVFVTDCLLLIFGSVVVRRLLAFIPLKKLAVRFEEIQNLSIIA